MDDLKLFASTKLQLRALLKVTENFSNSIADYILNAPPTFIGYENVYPAKVWGSWTNKYQDPKQLRGIQS